MLIRDGKELGKVKVVSMRREKQQITEAKPGEDCGLLLRPQLDFSEGDMLVSHRK